MGKILQFNFDYKSTQYQIEKSTTKAIAVVDNKIDCMLQIQIVVNGLGKQIDIEYLRYVKYAIINFHSIACMLISINVTIYRTIALPESYENSHYIMTTKLLRSCI